MKPRRVKLRDGRTGWQFRYTDPVDSHRRKRTEPYKSERQARRKFEEFLEGREDVARGLPDSQGWSITYEKLVERYLAEATIASDKRLHVLRRCLEANDLGLIVAADLAHVGKLNAIANKLVKSRGAAYVRNYVYTPLRQMSRWAATMRLIPHDPLQAWRGVSYKPSKRRRAFMPEEMRGILKAAEEIEAWHGRRRTVGLAFLTILITGNRPAAVLKAHAKDLDEGTGGLGPRIHLPPGNGRKRNGKATIVRELYEILKAVAPKNGPLLADDAGKVRKTEVVSAQFKHALMLYHVRRLWPTDAPIGIEPIEVAACIRGLRARKSRELPDNKHARQVLLMAFHLEDEINRLLQDRDLYTLRMTHISWGRRLGHRDSVRIQVGHSGDLEERHYVDLVDPARASAAVWDVLTNVRTLDGAHTNEAEHEQLPLLKAAGAEGITVDPLEGSAAQLAPNVAPDEKSPAQPARGQQSQPYARKGLKTRTHYNPTSAALNRTRISETPSRSGSSLSPCGSTENTLKTGGRQYHSAEAGPQSGPAAPLHPPLHTPANRDLWHLVDDFANTPEDEQQAIVDAAYALAEGAGR